jgi:hypothetical protein
VATLMPSAHFRRTKMSGRLSPFQRTSGPTPIRNKAGAISGTNTALKYGGPTDSLPMPSASMNSGYSVPSSTAATEAISTTLMASSSDSRENHVKAPPAIMRGERHANSASEPPTTTTMKPRM